MRFTAGRDPQTTSSGCSHGAVSPCQYQTRCSTRKVRIPTEGAKDSQLELGPQPLCSDGLLFLVSLAKRLLTTARGIHTGKGQEIDHPKLCGVPSGIGSESATEIEEGLPSDKAPRRSGKATQVNEIGTIVRPRDQRSYRRTAVHYHRGDSGCQIEGHTMVKELARNVTLAV